MSTPKICKQCTQQFTVTPEDLAFYDKVSPVINGKKYPIPAPTFCPDCRKQRRLAFRNERFLYHRKCDSCRKEIISMHSPDKKNTVYCQKCWWGDQYDPTDFGRDFDFNKSLAEQLQNLFNVVPLPPLVTDVDAEQNNCFFVNYAGNNKNCYMIFDSDYNEDSYYSNVLKHSKNCVDCSYTQASELCYECIDCSNCYNLNYSQNCTNCSDSSFLKNCSGCKNCLFCSNLSRKQYCIFNKQYTKEEYQKMLEPLDLGSRGIIAANAEKFDEFKLNFPQKYQQNIQTENCSGDYLVNAKNCHQCFNSGDAEDLKYCDSVYKAKDCYDVSSFGEKIEKIYEGGTIGLDSYDVLFSNDCVSNSNAVLYSMHVKRTKNCFASISTKGNQYCVLNKQYTREEYDELVPRIIEHMKKTGEWGEFFPMSLSPFGYNETIAQEKFPLTAQQAQKIGANWTPEQKINRYQGATIEIPNNIKDVKDEITKQILVCKTCGKNYKINNQELNFYKKKGLPAPVQCLNCRHNSRLAKRNPEKIYSRACSNCSAEIQTTYAPDRPEKVYCEACYLKEVY